jgi:hypothetical protein
MNPPGSFQLPGMISHIPLAVLLERAVPECTRAAPGGEAQKARAVPGSVADVVERQLDVKRGPQTVCALE